MKLPSRFSPSKTRWFCTNQQTRYPARALHFILTTSSVTTTAIGGFYITNFLSNIDGAAHLPPSPRAVPVRTISVPGAGNFTIYQEQLLNNSGQSQRAIIVVKLMKLPAAAQQRLLCGPEIRSICTIKGGSSRRRLIRKNLHRIFHRPLFQQLNRDVPHKARSPEKATTVCFESNQKNEH